MDEAIEAGFERGVLDRQLAADQPVGLLQRHRHHGADAEGLEAEVLARLKEEVEDRVLHLDRMVQLPAQFADEVDAERMCPPDRC